MNYSYNITIRGDANKLKEVWEEREHKKQLERTKNPKTRIYADTHRYCRFIEVYVNGKKVEATWFDEERGEACVLYRDVRGKLVYNYESSSDDWLKTIILRGKVEMKVADGYLPDNQTPETLLATIRKAAMK